MSDSALLFKIFLDIVELAIALLYLCLALTLPLMPLSLIIHRYIRRHLLPDPRCDAYLRGRDGARAIEELTRHEMLRVAAEDIEP